MNKTLLQLLRRLLVLLLSIFVLSVVVFTLSRLAPGDPLIAYYGEQAEKLSISFIPSAALNALVFPWLSLRTRQA